MSISTTGSGNGSSLVSQIHENEITASSDGASAVDIAWDGPATASLLKNRFAVSGAASSALNIHTLSSSELAQFAISENTFSVAGTDSRGLAITTAGPSTVSIGANTVDLLGSGGTGVDLSLAKSAEVFLYENMITDNVAGGTGIFFRSMTGPSQLTLQRNTLRLLGASSSSDIGIIFASITDKIELLDPLNNTVMGATTVFSAPTGGLDGYVIINGMRIP